jgi:hypothetical protein
LASFRSLDEGKRKNDVLLRVGIAAESAPSAWPHGKLACGIRTGGPTSVARTQLIDPRADPGCGKVFYGDRRTADWHRIALDFWNRATGCVRAGYRLRVYRCKRCGGFHIGQKRIDGQTPPF